jgi:hypothetical protein
MHSNPKRYRFHSPHLRRETPMPELVWIFEYEGDEYAARPDRLTEGTKLIEFVRTSDGWHGYAAAPADMPLDQSEADYAHLRLLLRAVLGRS